MGARNVLERVRMRILPPSARGVYVTFDEVKDALSSLEAKVESLAEDNRRLFARIEQADRGINGNIDYKFEGRLFPRLHNMSQELATHDAHDKILLWEIVRQEGESVREAKMRVHRSLPRATGVLRLLQRGNAALLRDFVALCDAHGVEYFLSYGSLLGAARQGGIIPWDDDLDVNMAFEDFDRLRGIVESDERYALSVVYDQYVYCKQIRFKYADAAIPCFVDVFIHDYTDGSDRVSAAYAALRKELVESVRREEEKNALGGEGKYLSAGDERSKGIADLYDRYRQRIVEEGLVCSREGAVVLQYGLENMDGAPDKDYSLLMSEVFPLGRLAFEGIACAVPKEYEKILERHYGDWLELPNDLYTHFEHIDRSSVDVRALVERFGCDG